MSDDVACNTALQDYKDATQCCKSCLAGPTASSLMCLVLSAHAQRKVCHDANSNKTPRQVCRWVLAFIHASMPFCFLNRGTYESEIHNCSKMFAFQNYRFSESVDRHLQSNSNVEAQRSCYSCISQDSTSPCEPHPPANICNIKKNFGVPVAEIVW